MCSIGSMNRLLQPPVSLQMTLNAFFSFTNTCCSALGGFDRVLARSLPSSPVSPHTAGGRCSRCVSLNYDGKGQLRMSSVQFNNFCWLCINTHLCGLSQCLSKVEFSFGEEWLGAWQSRLQWQSGCLQPQNCTDGCSGIYRLCRRTEMCVSFTWHKQDRFVLRHVGEE